MNAVAKPPEHFIKVLENATPAQQQALIGLRKMVYETAQGMDGVGRIEESLKWGQPAFATVRPKSGSPFRMAPLRGDPDGIALYFVCTTDLVSRFRERYGDTLAFVGNRAILLDTVAPIPEAEIRHCMAMALRYFAEK